MGVLSGAAKKFLFRRKRRPAGALKEDFFRKTTHFSQKEVRVMMGLQNHNNSYINILETVKEQPFRFFTHTNF